jgi:hypothetical protein
MAAYGNAPCFDSSKLGRDSPSGYQPFFCDPHTKPPEARLQKMNMEVGYGKLSMDPNFSDAYMMDGLGGGGYMPSGGLPQGPCSSSGPPMMGGPSVSHGYVGQNTGLHTNNYQSGPMSSSYLNPYMQFQGLGKVSHVSTPLCCYNVRVMYPLPSVVTMSTAHPVLRGLSQTVPPQRLNKLLTLTSTV